MSTADRPVAIGPVSSRALAAPLRPRPTLPCRERHGFDGFGTGAPGGEEALEFIAPKVSHKKLIEIRDKILDTADTLPEQPFAGQIEYLLEH
ncbi:MAG: hypothetical protein R6V16_03545 [Bacteroidales bacterium]